MKNIIKSLVIKVKMAGDKLSSAIKLLLNTKTKTKTNYLPWLTGETKVNPTKSYLIFKNSDFFGATATATAKAKAKATAAAAAAANKRLKC